MKKYRKLPAFDLVVRTYKSFSPYLRRQRTRILISFLCTILVIGCELLEPWTLKVVLDNVLLGKDSAFLPEFLLDPGGRETLLYLCAGFVLFLSVLAGVFGYGRDFFGAAAGQRVVMYLREDLQKHVQRLSLDFHLSARKGDLLLRLTGDLILVRELLVNAALEVSRHVLYLSGMAVVLLVVQPVLGAVALTVIPVFLILQSFFSDHIAGAAARQRENEARLAAQAGEILHSVELVQTYQLEEHLTQALHQHNRKSLKSGLTTTRLEARLARSLEISLAGSVAVILLLGAMRVKSDAMTPGDLVLYLAYVRATYKPLRKLSARLANLSKATAASQRVLDLLTIKPDIEEKAGAADLVLDQGPVVELRDVWVRFKTTAGDHSVLQGTSFVAPAGRCTLIVGANGAGKSTALSLVPRLRDVQSGAVLIDGQDVRDVTLASLRRRVAAVQQFPTLFSGSVADNIRLGDLEADDARVEEAALKAGIEAFLEGQPLEKFLDREVGEAGKKLSAGQRVRVSLARLVLRRPCIVLLDEPESSLDAASRGAVIRDVVHALPGATILLVSHHLCTPDLVDHVVVLGGGRVIDRGPLSDVAVRHSELLQSSRMLQEPQDVS